MKSRRLQNICFKFGSMSNVGVANKIKEWSIADKMRMSVLSAKFLLSSIGEHKQYSFSETVKSSVTVCVAF